ncbi:polar residue-rich protein 7 [Diadegma fenestrale ichnovirus]|nr:polar residue-rich protein 7 [Diadegma fenestrale ichnovirus]
MEKLLVAPPRNVGRTNKQNGRDKKRSVQRGSVCGKSSGNLRRTSRGTQKLYASRHRGAGHTTGRSNATVLLRQLPTAIVYVIIYIVFILYS